MRGSQIGPGALGYARGTPATGVSTRKKKKKRRKNLESLELAPISKTSSRAVTLASDGISIENEGLRFGQSNVVGDVGGGEGGRDLGNFVTTPDDGDTSRMISY